MLQPLHQLRHLLKAAAERELRARRVLNQNVKSRPLPRQPIDRALNRIRRQLQSFVARQSLPRSRMQHEILRAPRQRALNLATKSCHALFSNLFRLAAYVHQIAGMDHQRPDIELRPQFAHPLGLRGVHLGRAPHARTRRENLKSVRADLLRAFHRIRRPARRPQMHSDSLRHATSLNGPPSQVRPALRLKNIQRLLQKAIAKGIRVRL